MTTVTDHQSLRAQQRAEWNACAAGWRKHRNAFAVPGKPVTQQMLGST